MNGTGSMEQLLREFVEGSSAGLYERFTRLVRSTLLRQGVSADDLDDLEQEVWILVLRKHHNIRNVESFPGWLRTLAHTVAVNFLVRHRNLSGHDLLEFQPSDEDLPEDPVLLEELRSAVRAGVGKLRPLDSQALELFYFQGLSLVEICAHLDDTPLGTVKRRLHVARKRLAKALSDDARDLSDTGA